MKQDGKGTASPKLRWNALTKYHKPFIQIRRQPSYAILSKREEPCMNVRWRLMRRERRMRSNFPSEIGIIGMGGSRCSSEFSSDEGAPERMTSVCWTRSSISDGIVPATKVANSPNVSEIMFAIATASGRLRQSVTSGLLGPRIADRNDNSASLVGWARDSMSAASLFTIKALTQ